MIRIAATDVRSNFSEILNRVAYGGERMVIQRKGKDVAAIIPLDDLRLLELIEDKVDASLANEAMKEINEIGTIEWRDHNTEPDDR